ncbi:MAG: Gfo/Idh/MocA family oxidoreductase [Betaproteobacteria bacterium]
MTPSHPISLFMFGCGGFARRYHVQPVLDAPDVRIAGIFDPYPQAEVVALATRAGAPLCRRIEDLPGASGTAFAIITTPHTLHAAHIDAALDRGLHVLVDKPFVSTEADAIRLSKRANAVGLLNAVAYNRRFDAGCLRAREILRAGGIGAVRYVQTVQLGYERAGWFLIPELGGGGPYTGRASHMADIVPWLIERKPTALRSRLRSSSPTRSDHGGFIELRFDDLECHMTCIEEGWHTWDEIRIFGDDGLIELRRPLEAPLGWELTWSSQRGARREWQQADGTPGDATRDFLTALRGQGTPACTFAQAADSVRIIEQAFLSARNPGEWVTFAPAANA